MPRLDTNRILLVQPLGYRVQDPKHDVALLTSSTPPIGLAGLAAYLEQGGYKADIIDAFTRPGSDKAIADYLREHRPAYLGLSCITSNFLDGVRIAGEAKETLPGIRTLAGGPHVSALREPMLEQFPSLDCIVVGEGERPLRAFIEREGQDLSGVPGLIYRDEDGAVVFTGFQDGNLDLDALPFPAYDKLPGFPRAYRLPLFNYPRVPHSSCITSRGCPYECSYCDRSVFGRSFRYNSAEYMHEHLSLLKRQYGIRHVTFYDDQFTFDRKRVHRFAELMLQKPLRMTFNCAVRAEHVDLDLLKEMKAAGCWMISLGIETGDPELLAQHRQNADLELLAGKIRLIKSAGIHVKGLLMMGLPGETPESIRRSMDYVFSLPLDALNISKFTPFPGSPLYENIHDLGEFEEDWPAMDCLSFRFIPKGMTRTELEGLYKAFYRAHFRRPSVLAGYAKMVWKSPDSWLRFWTNMGSFIRFARRSTRHG